MLKIAGQKIHLVGIGGIGMSAIAQLAAEGGAVVDGCDLGRNNSVPALKERGFDCKLGHSPDHAAGKDIVVYSAAVPNDSPELVRARELGITVVSRSHMLAHLMQDQKSISVMGSHGKTTTTWLVSHMLIENGFNPTVMLGGNVSPMNGNFRRGAGEWFVSEVDESDGLPKDIGSFCSVVTNIDKEHLRAYDGSMDGIRNRFRTFLEATAPEGVVVVCAEDANAVDAASSVPSALMTYGLTPQCDVFGTEMRFDSRGAFFRAVYRGMDLGCFSTRLPGRHNVLNALGAISVGLFLNAPVDGIREALVTCPRVDRRLHVRHTGGLTVIDDYGHHPTEIRATLETIRAIQEGKILCVFQPHRFTRTQDLMSEFEVCFDAVDKLYVMPIYPANEAPIPGVTSEALVASIASRSPVDANSAGRDEILDLVLNQGDEFSTVVFLGAGDIVELADETVERLAVCCGV
jgi:UDP-N-acetylmuramate--alanine ligase